MSHANRLVDAVLGGWQLEGTYVYQSGPTATTCLTIRLAAPKVPALVPSQLQSFAYDGTVRLLEIEFRVTTPYAYDELPQPPPPKVIQYSEVPCGW